MGFHPMPEIDMGCSLDRRSGPSFIERDATGVRDGSSMVDCVWNVMTHARKPDLIFRQNGLDHLNRLGWGWGWGGGVSSVDYWQPRCAPSAVVMLDTSCSEVVWRVLANHSIRQFPLHFPSRVSPCAIIFQLDSTSPMTAGHNDTVLTNATCSRLPKRRAKRG